MVLVDASFNRLREYTVIVDTGAAVGVCSPDIARRLGLPTLRRTLVSDGGGHSVPAALTTVKELRLGDAVLLETPFVVTPLPEGAPAKAVVGVQLFRDYVVTLDFTHRELVLTPRPIFHPSPNAKQLPLHFGAGGRPVVDAAVDGRLGRFLLDTGNNTGLILNAGFVRTYDIARGRRVLSRGDGSRTVVGKRPSDATRLDVLEIGGFSIRNPVAALLRNTASAESDLAGNIGMDVLRQFDISFDFGGKTAYMVPNVNFGRPLAYDRVGMVFEKRHGAFVVTNVLSGSPAAEAGIHVGDHVVALDGQSVAGLDGIERREMLRQPVGTRLAITVRSNGRTRTVRLVLRDLL
jgi:predicted aspartyl protease